jgi:hypothetical protein
MTTEKVKRIKIARKELDKVWYAYLDCRKKKHGMKKKKVSEKVWQEKPERKKFVREQISLLKDRFYLQGWELSTDYFKFPNSDNSRVEARTSTEWGYRRILIEIYPPFWDVSEEEQKAILVHEFCHVLTSQIFVLLAQSREGKIVTADSVMEVNEHVTCWIQQIISAVDAKR